LTGGIAPRFCGVTASCLALALALGCDPNSLGAAAKARASLLPGGAVTGTPAPKSTGAADPNLGAIENATAVPTGGSGGRETTGPEGQDTGTSSPGAGQGATPTPKPTPTPTDPPLESNRIFGLEISNMPPGGALTLYLPPSVGLPHPNYPSAFTCNVVVTADPGASKAVAWTVSPSDVALVDSSNRIAALKAGTAIVTARTADGAFSQALTLTVKAEGGIDAEVQ
jgi:hypothetical protein